MFVLFTRESTLWCGAADAEVTIEGPAPADIVKKEVQNGVLTIDYLPVIPGEYMVSVKSHGKHIHGSPFSARISGSSPARTMRNHCLKPNSATLSC